MDLPAGTMIRVAYCEDFPNGDHIHKIVDSITAAKVFLRINGLDHQYQSDRYPMPGLNNFAVIEYFDETDGSWKLYTE